MADRTGRRRPLLRSGTGGASPVLVAISPLAPVAIAGPAQLPTAPALALVLLCVLATAAALAMASRSRTELRGLNAQISHLSGTDPLTGLSVMHDLDAAIQRAMDESRTAGRLCALLLIELDGLTHLNETHGVAAGDQVIVAVVRRMHRCVHEDDRLVRVGGTRFLVICAHADVTSTIEELAQELIRSAEAPFHINGGTLALGARVGVGIATGGSEAPKSLFKDTEGALRHTRRSSSGTYALFDRDAPDALLPAALERRLQVAVEGGEFQLLYQPVVSLWTRRMVGVEALLRWVDPGRGVLGPAEFMDALERAGHLAGIGTWILDEVCRQSRAWSEQFPARPALTIQVNLTSQQIRHPDLPQVVASSLSRHGADAGNLCLEVAESREKGEADLLAETLRGLSRLGVSLALDDFGGRSSSVRLLRSAPFRMLKLERDLVAGSTEPGVDRTTIQHLLSMAKSLALVSVAIGVEMEGQVEALRSLGCDLAQGYYFSHPQPPQVIGTLLESDGNRQEWQPPPPPDAALVRDGPRADTARFRVADAGSDEGSPRGRADAPDALPDGTFG